MSRTFALPGYFTGRGFGGSNFFWAGVSFCPGFGWITGLFKRCDQVRGIRGRGVLSQPLSASPLRWFRYEATWALAWGLFVRDARIAWQWSLLPFAPHSGPTRAQAPSKPARRSHFTVASRSAWLIPANMMSRAPPPEWVPFEASANEYDPCPICHGFRRESSRRNLFSAHWAALTVLASNR